MRGERLEFFKLLNRLRGYNPFDKVASSTLIYCEEICSLSIKILLAYQYSGDVAQLGEHLVCNQGVGGSIPLSSTIYCILSEVAVVDLSGPSMGRMVL